MKFFQALFIFLFFSNLVFGQDSEIKFKEYSYAEFFELIENEKDTLFVLKNALIKVNPNTDDKYLVKWDYYNGDSISFVPTQSKTINKAIELNNVHFKEYFNQQNGFRTRNGLFNIVFEKSVSIINSSELNIEKCIFKKEFSLGDIDSNSWPKRAGTDIPEIYISNSKFLHRTFISFFQFFLNNLLLAIYIEDNLFSGNAERSNFSFFHGEFVVFEGNNFSYEKNYDLHFEQLNQLSFEENSFNSGLPEFYCIEIEELIFQNNNFNIPSLINFKATNNVNFIGENQFKAKTSSSEGFSQYRDYRIKNNLDKNYKSINALEVYKSFEEGFKIENPLAFQKEVEQKSVFYNYFKEKFHTKEANRYYTEIKDLESQRIAYEHKMNPTFSTFFKLQINEFLRVFSNYGTQPERAIIVSIYVILFFAFIYLFFPNTWDKHGRKRIVDRYTFFLKYMDRNAGIHEVYLEDKKDELLEFKEFKEIVESKEKKVPRIFTATAMPLYKWAISGTKLSATLLRRVDIMNGTWQDLPQSKRIWKSILLIGAFLVAVCYDIIIKMLNAIMLSINTFTTLGFGEIPIKGLPRYLAIIQGFIGWFMLTIFSVSLISQLLN